MVGCMSGYLVGCIHIIIIHSVIADPVLFMVAAIVIALVERDLIWPFFEFGS